MSELIRSEFESVPFTIDYIHTLQNAGPLRHVDCAIIEGQWWAWDAKNRTLVIPEELEQDSFAGGLAKVYHEIGHVFNLTDITLNHIDAVSQKTKVPQLALYAFDYVVEEMTADHYVASQSPGFLAPKLSEWRKKNALEAAGKFNRRQVKQYQINTPLSIQFCDDLVFLFQSQGLQLHHPGAGRNITRLSDIHYEKLADISLIKDETERVKAIFQSQAFNAFLELYQSDMSNPQFSLQSLADSIKDFIRETVPSQADNIIQGNPGRQMDDFISRSENDKSKDEEKDGKERKTGDQPETGQNKQKDEPERPQKWGKETKPAKEDQEYTYNQFLLDWERAGKIAFDLYSQLYASLMPLAAGQEEKARRSKRFRVVDEGDELYIEAPAGIISGFPKYTTPPGKQRGEGREVSPYYQTPLLLFVVDQSGSQDSFAKQRGFFTIILERLKEQLEIDENKLPLYMGIIGVDTESITILDINDDIKNKSKALNKKQIYQRIQMVRSKRGGTAMHNGIDAACEMFEQVPDEYKRKALLVVMTDLGTNISELNSSLSRFLKLHPDNHILGLITS